MQNNKKLYESIINDIAKIVKSELNEMAKNISFRNIDRNVWLSVASTISKNKSTEAEFIKPMKKLTLDDLLQRYIAALLISKKPCPKTKKDIENLKTYKLYALKALELGATISDIKDLYNQNNNAISAAKAKVKKETAPSEKPLINKSKRTIQKISSKSLPKIPKSNKYQNLLDSFIQHLPERLWNNIRVNYYLEDQPFFKKCQPDLEVYIKSIIKKSHNSFEKFGELIQKDFSKFYKLMNNNNEVYIKILKHVGYTYSTFNTYEHYFNINITKDVAEIYATYEYNDIRNRSQKIRNSYNDPNLFKNLTSYVPNIHVREKVKPINLLLEFCKELFKNVVYPYINFKKEQKYNNNKLNIAEIFKKYNITDNITDIKRWVRNNLRTILYNNPDMHIKINYGDWQGSLTDVYYNSELDKYIIRVYCQGDSSDSDSADYLNNFLNANNSYKFYDREDYYCIVHDLDQAYENLYTNIINLINDGKIS